MEDLYQALILDHNKSPRNRRVIAHASRTAEGFNPLCGDRITVYLDLQDDIIKDVSFQGGGCAISTASASLMTQAMKGKTIDEAKALFERFHHFVLADRDADRQDNGETAGLGKLKVFSNVNRYPARVKCATLAWHTVRQALNESKEAISTE